MTQILRIATRKSPLALWQAEYVRDRLVAAHTGLRVELEKMSTQGDKILASALAKIGGKGLFVKELEDGQQYGRGESSGPRGDAERLGVALADELLAQGAAAILKAVYASGR